MEKSASRLKLLALLVALMFVALSTRLWFLQVLAVEENRQLAQGQSIRFTPVETLRGNILDVNGNLIVGNRMSLQVRIDRQALGDDAEAPVR